ncbi:MAG: hypothetical protein NT004_15300 [Bacteroidetes bacterium]|nr:hypothetical protein [Bacteroidota bacterium]
MKHIISFYAALLMVCAISLVSCNKKTNDPDPTPNPFGSWTRTYTGTETYRAQINLNAAGTFEWIILDTLSTHTNSYSKIQVNGDQIRFYEDPDLPVEGIYTWTLSGGTLTLAMVSDSYPARASALVGIWNQKNPADLAKIIGSWQKTVVEQGNSYRVKLILSADRALKWEMIDPIPGHTNSTVSFAATENTIVIHNDPDCDGNGYFAYSLNGTDLTCTYLKDKCPPRSQSFSGTWSKME